jgi:NADPH-dependent curcumin reductase CurA
MKFKRYLLKSFPSSTFPEDLSCFELKHDAEIDEQAVPEGHALLKIYWTSTDPLLRTWISGAKSYLDPVRPGSGVPGFGIAKVIKINPDPKKKTIIEEGDWVSGMLEWSEYMLVNYRKIQKLPLVPSSHT